MGIAEAHAPAGPVAPLTHFTLSDEAVPYLCYQRTQYLSFTNTPIVQKLLKMMPGRVFKTLVGIESDLRGDAIKRAYFHDMQVEYDRIRGYLPKTAKNILDIGCGIAGIDALISQHYDHAVHIHLLDKSTIEDDIFYSMKDKAAFYNSLEVAKDFLVYNAVPKDHILTINANNANTIDTDTPMDLILSLISWGFHYPVKTYLTQAFSQLKEGGRLIIDIRKGTDGEKAIEAVFDEYKIIYDGLKHHRILAVKGGF